MNPEGRNKTAHTQTCIHKNNYLFCIFESAIEALNSIKRWGGGTVPW